MKTSPGNLPIVLIEGKEVPVILYRGQPVVTFRMIDELHERIEGTAKRAFHEHKEQFVEGEDFFNVPFEEWSVMTAVRNTYGGRDTGQRNPMKFITEPGYLLLVKPLSDPRAWQVQKALRKSYFAYKEIASGDPSLQRYKTRLPSLQTVLNTWGCAIKNGRSAGLSHREAAERANEGTLKAYGIDVLDWLGINIETLPHKTVKQKVAEANLEEGARQAQAFFEALNTLPKKEREKCVDQKEDQTLLRLSLALKTLKSHGHRFVHSELMKALKEHPAFVASNFSRRAYFGSKESSTVKVWVFDSALLTASSESEGGRS